MLVSRLFSQLFTSLGRSPGASRVRALIAQAERAQADPAAALAALEAAAALEPDNPRVHALIAELHIHAGRLEPARHHLERATARGATAQDLTKLGNVCQLCGDAGRAESAYARALALDGTSQLAHYNLAFLMRSQGRFAEALTHLRAAHESMGLRGAMLRTFVNALLEVNAFDEAQTVSEPITRAEPGCVDAWLCLGLTRQKLHRSKEALACYDRALALGADDAELRNSRAIAFQYLGRWDEAHAEYARALAHDPDYVLARFHRGLARLAQHRYAAGWPDYEARLLNADSPAAPVAASRWKGEPLEGRKLLVYGEQGLGDEIMFASCVPDVIAAGARCVVECAPRLKTLFARSFPAATVRAAGERDGDDGDAFDFQVPSGSLPAHLRRSVADFPRHRGYLQADPEKVAAWSRRLQALGPGLKVGLSWRGGTHKTRSPLRSMDLESLLPILRLPGVRFVSLQYTPGAADEAAAFKARHGIDVTHWPEAIDDYDETAALVSSLDLTVSVCTAIVHLAGALGRPIWVMAPTGAEWRYGHAGAGMPWYPSVRIFRQRLEGEWSEPVTDITRRLPAVRVGDEAETVRESAQKLNHEGVAKLSAGDFDGAQRSFEAALGILPYLAEARSNLGIALIQQGLEAAGEHALREAIELDPGLVNARENLAVQLVARYDHDGAKAAWDEVLEQAPQHANAHAGRAFLALREGRFEEAAGFRARAIELGAEAVPLRMQEAAALAMSGETGGAKRLLDTLAGAADPHDLDWERALCELYERRFDRAWPLYEARLTRRFDASRRPYDYPAWDGRPLAKGALLILGEQGIGDEIMFASCYREAIARAGACIIECEPRLEALFARSFPQAEVLGQPRAGAHPELVGRPDIAAQVHCGSLPRFFRLREADFPPHEGYLAADRERVERYRRRFGGAERKRVVGISWSGGLKHTRRALRTIPPELFARVLRGVDAEFVSLQHDDDGTAAGELARLAAARVHVVPEAFADFDELAALVASLDCVVTACSTVVHLAGALGRPALVATPKHAEWRYLLEGSTMPWYPSVRLMRQAQSGDWTQVIEAMRAALADQLEDISGVTRA